MGLWNWLNTKITGVDVDAEVERAKALDTVVASQNVSALERGVWTEQQYRDAEQRRGAHADEIETYWPGVTEAYQTGAIEGATGIADTVRGTVNDVAKGALSITWRTLPWWVWLLALIYAAWQLGLLKRISAR